MKEKILELLMHHNGKCLSGQDLSQSLGISRTAVWKHIKSLQELGYPIQSIDRKGYQLDPEESFLLASEIKKRLGTKTIGTHITVLPSIESTNLYAKEMQDQLSDGDVVIAEEQTQGKGRRGKAWSSPRGKGIWATIFLKPTFSVEKASSTTQLAAAAMWQSIYHNTGIKCEIKWPNDLLINGKKICGILTELTGEIGQIEYLLVGLGLNVNNIDFPDEIKDVATSLRLATGRNVNRTELLIEFLQMFEVFYTQMEREHSSERALRIIRENSSVLGRPLHVIRGGMTMRAMGIRILENGNLEVEYEDKSREILSGGEVSVRNMERV